MNKTENTLQGNQTINTPMNPATNHFFPLIEYLSEVSSTNDYLLSRSQQSTENRVCLATKQLHGRGRRGQSWLSNASDISFSVLWNTDIPLNALSGTGLVVALMTVNALNNCFPDTPFSVKWPNDIFYQNKKIGGILIETTRNQTKTAVVIGIGINISDDAKKQKLPNPYACLNDVAGKKIDTNSIIFAIINQLKIGLSEFSEQGLSVFIEKWKQYDRTINQNISLIINRQQVSGINRGVNSEGELILLTENNEEMHIRSGKII